VVTQYQPEEKVKLKRQWLEQAVSLAIQGRWDEAISVNNAILALFPSDADAFNRLGKAYLELKRYQEAHDAYGEAVRLAPNNIIARKNLQRLSKLLEEGAPVVTAVVGKTSDRVAPDLFIEETGKTGVTALTKLADAVTLAKLTAGDTVLLRVEGQNLAVYSPEGDYIGQVEARLGRRLVNFIKAGNEYAARVTSISDHQAKIIIRETLQHPSMRGRISFPPKGAPSDAIRPYIKDSVLRYGLDGDEEEPFGDMEYGEENELEMEETEEEPEFAEDTEVEE
jgi:tetratricopeptide (TPR) repeat protein